MNTQGRIEATLRVCFSAWVKCEQFVVLFDQLVAMAVTFLHLLKKDSDHVVWPI